ncbi:MAG: VWA domain-containing protein [Anaerolineae bacterium]
MRASHIAAAAVTCLLASWVGTAVGRGPVGAEPELGVDEIYAACNGDNPYFAVAAQLGGTSSRTGPALLAVNDTPDSGGAGHPALATRSELGSVYGLAFDWRRGHLYAAAYHRRGQPYGPGGPGQIYRIDLATGTVERWAVVDAGPDRHDPASPDDDAAAAWVGRSSLGDIEIDDNGLNLYVANLATNEIHRLSVPDGRELGRFASGAAAEEWALNARLFGLGYDGGRLYHAVVDSRADGALEGSFAATVYRTLADGSNPVSVADFELGYDRDPQWSPWSADPGLPDAPPQPMVVDLEFSSEGDMLIGLRDRAVDARHHGGGGTGDLLGGSRAGSTWLVQTSPEQFADEWTHDESLLGALASFPGFDGSFAPASAPIVADTVGTVWYYNPSGTDIARETVLEEPGPGTGPEDGLGDAEVLCGPPGAMTATPTVTPSPTPTPTATPAPAFLPVALRESCPPTMLDVALVMDLSTSMRDATADGRPKLAAALDAADEFVALLQLEPGDDGSADRASIVGFNATAWTEQVLTDDAEALSDALAGLVDEVETGTRLDLALAAGAEALADARTGATPVLILLTDGRPTGVPPGGDGRPETTVLEAASAVRAGGIYVFTIGLGTEDDVDSELLIAIAGSPDRHVHAPTASDLEEIYRQLAEDVRCPPGRHDWSKPWP